MRTSVSTGLDLINRSLDIYKMETGMYRYEPQDVDILAIAHRVIVDLSGLAGMKGVTIVATRSEKSLALDESMIIPADESLCYSLLANLMKNGIEASALGQHISMDIRDSPTVTIAIHNPTIVPVAVQDTFLTNMPRRIKSPVQA